MISSAEREAAYVIDGLMLNGVIKSDVHSTDTYGFSEVVFGVTMLLGFGFAPRIKGLSRQQLYAFNSSKYYEKQGCVLLPDRFIRESIIEQQWDEIGTIQLK